MKTSITRTGFLLADIIFQAVRQQRLLHAIFAIDEPMHLQAPEAPKLRDSKAASPRAESVRTSILCRFHTAWTHSGRSLPSAPRCLPSDGLITSLGRWSHGPAPD